MRHLIVNHHPTRRVDRPSALAALRLFCRLSQETFPPENPWAEVQVVLVDDTAMAEINSDILGHEGPTDVITQRYEPMPGEPDGLVGEIYINLDEADRVGRRASTSPAREVLLYLAHGCDHLSDADDATPAERRRMRRRELRWLAQLPLELPAKLMA